MASHKEKNVNQLKNENTTYRIK